MAVTYNPWGGTGADIQQKSKFERAGTEGDFGLQSLQTLFGGDVPQVDGNVANLAQMGAVGAARAKYAGDTGMVIDPATGQAIHGLSNQDMDAYLRASGSMLPPVGGMFSPGAATGAGRTADQISNAAITRTFNPLESYGDPTADTAAMMAQRDYLRSVAGGAPTAAQQQLQSGLDTAKAGQASLAAGLRGAQASAARRASQEAQLDLQNQGQGQMAVQRASDVLSAQGQLQGMNQAISQGLGQRQDLITAGQRADATTNIQNQAAAQEALRAQLANLAVRNDLTAEQKQQMLQAWQTRAQADRMRDTYGLRGLQSTATRQLQGVQQSTGQAATGGAVTDRVNMARFTDDTERGAAATAAIGAGAGMALRGLGSGTTTDPATGKTRTV